MRERSGGLWFEASLGKEFVRPYLKKAHHKNGLVEWLKVKALSSNPNTTKKKNKKRKKNSVNSEIHIWLKELSGMKTNKQYPQRKTKRNFNSVDLL
jgi:hypothetical protein